METLRTIILAIGWPVLIAGSIFLVWKSIAFYHAVRKAIWGRLVLGMVIGWLVSMYSLGIVATMFMIVDVTSGVSIVLPVFIVWFITMVAITLSVLQWSKEAVTLSAFYQGLEQLVNEKTKELEKAYNDQLAREKELRKLQERFTFIAAHELRTPVTSLAWGISSMIEDKQLQGSLSEGYRTLLKNLHAKNQNLVELVDDLLQIARLQGTAEQSVQAKEIIFKDLASDIEENVRSLATKAGVLVRWPVLEKQQPAVQANVLFLKEVLTNLVTNAIRYNRKGGWVIVDSHVQERELIIQVKDNGIGMTKDEQGKLFQEFYRVQNKETEGIEGTGLGLFVSKQLLDRIHGRIWVDSTKGEGSTFNVALPLSSS